MARGGGVSKNRGKGKGKGKATGRSTFMDLPSPPHGAGDDQSIHTPGQQMGTPDRESTLDPANISWGSDLDTASISSNTQNTPLTDPYGNPTLQKIIASFIQKERNKIHTFSSSSSSSSISDTPGGVDERGQGAPDQVLLDPQSSKPGPTSSPQSSPLLPILPLFKLTFFTKC